MEPTDASQQARSTTEARGANDLDLTEAWALARGQRQRLWLNALLDPDNGLRPGDGATGRWASSVYQRIEAFGGRLRCAGYIVEKRPFGPRRIMRFVLVGSSPTYGAIAQARAAGVCDALDDNGIPHPDLVGLTPVQLEILVGLVAPDRPASAVELAAVARCLAT